MTKSTITRERIQQIFLGNGPEPSASEERELARIALAAMDSEPVAWTDEQELRDVDRGGCGYLFTVNPVTPHADERRIILLYRHAQPAPVVPVVPDEMPEELLKPLLIKWDEYEFSSLIAQDIWNACRAAMQEVKP
ncbi:hypothetical protein [Klebsiella pneumoniae]|uniref:hypothetical protein n=1 Tax=Klebsiella pneumoniae TaxID=573 RepID=UPI0019539289|nr:hypothetical protein [Klebsiella pneumoniae]MDU0863049.1 hypothetical protein [Serratia marcescens]